MGATYETDGGPALLKRRADGTLLSLRDGIAKHCVASIATFETTARRAHERVKDYLAYRQQAVSDGKAGAIKRAGFTFPDNTERLLKGTALIVHEKIGGGHLVAFANDPMFRGFWRAMDRLVLNAVLLGPTF